MRREPAKEEPAEEEPAKQLARVMAALINSLAYSSMTCSYSQIVHNTHVCEDYGHHVVCLSSCSSRLKKA